ncbi:MAG: Agmatinase [Pseudomonadota bacterium]
MKQVKTTKRKTSLPYLPGAKSFLDPLRRDANQPEQATILVIPFPAEASVSYGGGTRLGPQAILSASQQLELYDPEFGGEPYADYGIAALPVAKVEKKVPKALDQLEALVEGALDAGHVPFVLGGEHSLTAGSIRPFAKRHKDLVVLQFDAHADLRDGYLGEPYSHAAAMRRVLDQPGHDHIEMVQVGIRGFSAPEAEYMTREQKRLHVHLAKDMPAWDMTKILAPLKGRPVYITVDIDCLDGSIMPATGTPTPGGMVYPQLLAFLREACRTAGDIVGMDLVELAPIKGFHAYDFLAAELAYKMMSYAFAKPQ